MKFKINEDLKLIREMLNLSQEEISLFIDVDKKTITRLENNENYPTNETLEKIYNFVTTETNRPAATGFTVVYRAGLKITKNE